MPSLIASLRLVLVTLLACAGVYTGIVLSLARAVAPRTADGSLLYDPAGRCIGSRLLAQAFTNGSYFWPRPSAVGYNASAAGGSNKASSHPDLAVRARKWIAAHGASARNPLPADLAATSGSGLDPHLTLAAAFHQAPRVAAARGMPVPDLRALIEQRSFPPGGVLTQERLVNVLELNLALDAHVRR